MWTPDVYEGAPTPVTAFFAAAPKVAGIAIFVRATVVAFPGITHEWQQIVVFVSIASMVLGAFAAIGQRNIKRLMAYSSIGHMGFALVGLAAGTPEGVQGVLIYMSIYVAMTLGTFACILAMRRDGTYVENIADLAGLSRTHPATAFFLAMLLFSLAGIPPLAGFFAKYFVFLAAIKAGLYVLAVIGVLTSVVGAFYYLSIVKIMYFDEPAQKLPEHAGVVADRARRVRPDQYPVLCLSGAAAWRGDGGGEVAFLRRDPESGTGQIAHKMHREATDLAGVRHIAYETLGSTNAEALARARAGERGPLWITARSQSAGRGRRGSAWISPPGNLYATLLLSEPSSQAVGAATVVRGRAGAARCAVRMRAAARAAVQGEMAERSAARAPKLAGILIEGRKRAAFSPSSIGFGVNCVSHPPDTFFPATDLLLAGAVVAPEALLAALSAAMLRRLAQWQSGTRLCLRSAPTGWRVPPVSARISACGCRSANCAAAFEGLDEAGRLLVQQPDGLATVTAGEVFGLGGA